MSQSVHQKCDFVIIAPGSFLQSVADANRGIPPVGCTSNFALCFLEGVSAGWSGKLTAVSFLSHSDDVTLPSSAKLQPVTGWTPHMSGKGGKVH